MISNIFYSYFSIYYFKNFIVKNKDRKEKSILIIFNYKDEKCLNLIDEFCEFLKANNFSISVIYYQKNNKNFEFNNLKNKFLNISKNDFNFFSLPKNQKLITKLSNVYDYLFDLSVNKSNVINFLVKLSNSRIKVGKFFDLNNVKKRNIDINISTQNKKIENGISEIKELEILIKNIKEYLFNSEIKILVA